jgi:hypothetical protein
MFGVDAVNMQHPQANYITYRSHTVQSKISLNTQNIGTRVQGTHNMHIFSIA